MSAHAYADPLARDTRLRLHLSQTQFAQRFGFNITTLRQWEQGQRRPAGPARVLLMVIAHAPEAVAQALRDASANA